MRLIVVADDLTGAADTGIQLAKRGFYTILLPFGMYETGSRHIQTVSSLSSQAAALSTNSRGEGARSAYYRVRNATACLIRESHPQYVYKKIDSTLRGNVGAEIEAVMEAAGSEAAILAPAFPEYGRTTVEGIHYVNGQLLSQTEAAFDPVSPVTESHIPTLLQKQTRLKIASTPRSTGHLPMRPITAGASAP